MSANPKFKADFSTKEAFLASLWDAYEHAQREENVAATKGPYPKRFQNTRDQFYETGVPMADHTYAGIIDRNDGMLARNGTMKFLIGMRSYMKAHTDNRSPREWYGVFDDAFARGQISIMAWGAAARQIYVSHGPHPADAGRFHAETLDRFRLAPRESLMLPDEIQRFDAYLQESSARCDLTMPPATGGCFGSRRRVDTQTRWRDTDSGFSVSRDYVRKQYTAERIY